MTDLQSRLAAALTGRYRIERALGSGGMATVYLAYDEKHDRRVAIKVLKPELAAVLGAERFVVEIKTTAALQHPHILPLFDSGEADGFLFYVMPYIEGETIRDKLNRETQFSVEEAVRITTEIADALDYAHRHGVIHRDIKPENLLLHDGRAMVMDFGIALAVSAAAGGRMTETGLSLGTPHYMSPEQATADKSISARSDVYSLASVLYEMLTGNPPHVGSSAQQIIMKIITEPATPVTAHRKTVPPNVASALARALEKLPADRFESAKAFREALGAASFTYANTAPGTSAVAAVGASASGGSRRVAMLATAVAVLAVGAAAAGWMRPTPEPEFRRVDMSLGDLALSPASEPVISPDGRMIAVSATNSGTTGIYVRHLDGDADFRKVPGTDGGTHPTFSPDNGWIAFRRVSDRSLVKVRVDGGGAVTLVSKAGFDPWYPDWGEDGRITFSGPLGNGIVPSSGGEPIPLPMVEGRRPWLLPDGTGALTSANGSVALYTFATDSSTVLFEGGRHPVYVSTGHILYVAAEGGLFAVRFDLKSRTMAGEPMRVLERVGAGINTRGFSVSATGDLLQYDADGAMTSGNTQLVIVDPGRDADTVRVPAGRYYLPRFSRDGRSIAMEVFLPARNGLSDISTVDLVSGIFTQLTFDGDNDQPVWSPDGRSIAFDRRSETGPGQEDLCVKPADNSAAERCNTGTRRNELALQQWRPDSSLIYSAFTSGQNDDILRVSPDSASVPQAYAPTPFAEFEPQVSPDGRLIAFVSNETGRNQLWLRDYPVPQGKWSLSSAAARAPRWTPDGNAVYFWRAGVPIDTLFRVRLDRRAGVVVQQEEVVSTVNIDGLSNWDLHPDGRRVLLTLAATTATNGSEARPTRYLLLQNWFGELRRLTAAQTR